MTEKEEKFDFDDLLNDDPAAPQQAASADHDFNFDEPDSENKKMADSPHEEEAPAEHAENSQEDFALDEEEVTQFSEETPRKKPGISGALAGGIMPLIKENWLYIVFGGVGMVVALWLVFGILFPSAPQRPAPQQQGQNFGLVANPAQQGLQQPQPTPVAVQSAQPQAPAPSNNYVIGQDEMQQLLSGFKNVVQTNSNPLS